MINYSPGQVADIELGRRRPTQAYAEQVDAALGAGGQLLALLESQEEDTPLSIATRVTRLRAVNADGHTVAALHAAVDQVVVEDESPSGDPVAAMRRVRQVVDQLLAGHQRPRHRVGLYAVAARAAGVLAVLHIDAGRLSMARAYAVEAYALADYADRPDLQAWVRASQALVEYYAGRPADSLALARDGLRQMPLGSPLAIRLYAQGEARALARLGDADGVERAVAAAVAALEDHPVAGVSPNLTEGPYCRARTSGCAASAYLLVDRPDEAVRCGQRALVEFDTTSHVGPRALTRLDIARAMLASREPEAAAAIAVEAIDQWTGTLSWPVTARVQEVLAAASQWADLPAVRHLGDAVRTRGRRADVTPALPSAP